MRRARFATVLVAGALASVLVISAPGGSLARASEDPGRSIPAAETQVRKFFTLLQEKDQAGLEKFLSPAFELQRADGSGSRKAEYLQNLPTVESFELTDFTASRAGGVLVVRYLAEATGIVDGRSYTPGPAPRLSVFARDGKRWQIVAHANFNPLGG